jgi:hypothetical protein
MTLLDDYDAPYKLHGINIVSEMLERVPKELLKRTGVDGLLFGVCLHIFLSVFLLFTQIAAVSSP